MSAIGVDFGTCFTTMSYMDGGRAVPIRVDGRVKIPTMLYFPAHGEPLIGQRAYAKYEECEGEETEETEAILSGMVTDLKRNMSLNGTIPTPQGNISYIDAVAKILAYLKQYAERHVFNGESVTKVCLTYPVAWDAQPEKKDVLRQAGQRAGFADIRLLKEPVAAAMSCQNSRKITNKGVLIYDFGGGTFDLSYVHFDNDGNEDFSLPPKGDPACGGQDIDRALYTYWDKKVNAQRNRHISQNPQEYYIPILKRDCVTHKELMSQGTFQGINLALQSANFDTIRIGALSENLWTEMIEPWIDKTINLTRQMLSEVDQEANQLNFVVDEVILIGGSSRFPMVADKLREICPVAPTEVPEVDVAVANGAALFVNEDIDIESEQTWHCIECGEEVSARHCYCMMCGTTNFSYDHRYDDV